MTITEQIATAKTMPTIAPQTSYQANLADPLATDPIRAELFGLDHLETHARTIAPLLARTQVVAGLPLLRLFRRNARALVEAHRIILAAGRDRETLGNDADWLLDNFHIIAEALAEIRRDLPRGYYHRLPKLQAGPLAGYPRVLALALELIAHCDSSLEETHLTRFVNAFQTITPLTVGELWAFPIMLRLCLVDNLRRLAEHIVQFRSQRTRARAWIESNATTFCKQAGPQSYGLHNVAANWRDCYVAHLH